MTVAGYDNFKSTVPKEGSIRWTEAACLCADSKNKELALKWIDYMSTAKVQSKLVYTKGFKARAPNMKIVDSLGCRSEEADEVHPGPGQSRQDAGRDADRASYPRGLPTQQPETAWQAIFNEFKSAWKRRAARPRAALSH